MQDLIARTGRSDAAAAMVLARIWPVPRGRAVTFHLPPIGTPADAAGAMAAILEAAARGEVTPEEAATLASVLERYGKLMEVTEMEQRIAALERAAALGGVL